MPPSAAKKKRQQKKQQQVEDAARAPRPHDDADERDDDDGSLGDLDGGEADDDDDDDDDGDDGDDRVRLAVRQSTIPGAGDGLFLASRIASKGTVLLQENAVPIKRKDAKRILSMPEWKNQHPLIQCNKDNFLDIRKLTLYKSNHAEEEERCCNAAVAQTSNTTLTMTARRDIHRGEELMWQYAKNWLAGYTPGE